MVSGVGIVIVIAASVLLSGLKVLNEYERARGGFPARPHLSGAIGPSSKNNIREMQDDSFRLKPSQRHIRADDRPDHGPAD